MNSFFSYFTINPQTGVVDLNPAVIAVLIIAGFTVGVINTFAGSGSVITYSLFMMIGLPPTVANGTIRFGVLLQTFAASSTFWRGNKLPIKKGLTLSIPVIAGTVLGALIATHINKDVFKIVLAIVMVFMLFFIFFNPKRWLTEQTEKINKHLSPLQVILFFLLVFTVVLFILELVYFC